MPATLPSTGSGQRRCTLRSDLSRRSRQTAEPTTIPCRGFQPVMSRKAPAGCGLSSLAAVSRVRPVCRCHALAHWQQQRQSRPEPLRGAGAIEAPDSGGEIRQRLRSSDHVMPARDSPGQPSKRFEWTHRFPGAETSLRLSIWNRGGHADLRGGSGVPTNYITSWTI